MIRFSSRFWADMSEIERALAPAILMANCLGTFLIEERPADILHRIIKRRTWKWKDVKFFYFLFCITTSLVHLAFFVATAFSDRIKIDLASTCTVIKNNFFVCLINIFVQFGCVTSCGISSAFFNICVSLSIGKASWEDGDI